MRAEGTQEHHAHMQEILSSSREQNIALCGQEFYELQLVDPLSEGLAYTVRWAHARWDETLEQICWDTADWEEFATFEQARAGYERRRDLLVGAGFRHSDLDW